MPISQFVNQIKEENGGGSGKGLKRDYRRQKQKEAAERQATSYGNKVGRRKRKGQVKSTYHRIHGKPDPAEELLRNLFEQLEPGDPVRM